MDDRRISLSNVEILRSAFGGIQNDTLLITAFQQSQKAHTPKLV